MNWNQRDYDYDYITAFTKANEKQVYKETENNIHFVYIRFRMRSREALPLVW